MSHERVSSTNATVAGMTNHNDVTPADLAPRSHADQARHHLVQAHRHGRRAGDALEAGDHQQVGIHAARQRLQLKYAEANAQIAIADELARIGLSR